MMLILLIGLACTSNRSTMAIAMIWVRQLQSSISDNRHRRWLTPVLLFCVFAVFYTLRVQGHYLGDSRMWIEVFEGLQKGLRPIDSTHIHPVFGFVPPNEALDAILHYHLYRLGHSVAGWAPEDSYLWMGCSAGLVYIAVSWRTACQLFRAMVNRLACFSALSSLGILQLFFGYVESYTLVTAAMSVYLLIGLKSLERGKIGLAIGLFVLCCGLHLQALSLFPSVLFILYRRFGLPPAFMPSRTLVFAGSIVSFLALVWAYATHYPFALALWPVDGGWEWWLLSPEHLLQLSNTVLLVAPLTIGWAIQGARGSRLDARSQFLAISAIGPVTVACIHNAYLGGRDWDLLSFPAYPLTLLAISLFLRGRDRFQRALTVCVLQAPLVLVHTLLWVGINASEELGVRRLGGLLDSGNLAPHYEAYTRAHYMERHAGSPAAALPYVVEAIKKLPADDPEGMGARYYKFLGSNLTSLLHLEEGRQAYAAGFGLSKALVETTSDIVDHTRWLLADYGIARERRQAGLPMDNVSLHGTEARCRELMSQSPTDKLSLLCGTIYVETGHQEQAQFLLRRGLTSESLALGCIGNTSLGKSLARSGNPEAVTVLREALSRCNYKTEAPEILEAANELLGLGDYPNAKSGYEDVLRRDPDHVGSRNGLGWCSYKMGDYAGAYRDLLRANSQVPSSISAFRLALSALAKGDTQEAVQLYTLAHAIYGSKEAGKIGAIMELQKAPVDSVVRKEILLLFDDQQMPP